MFTRFKNTTHNQVISIMSIIPRRARLELAKKSRASPEKGEIEERIKQSEILERIRENLVLLINSGFEVFPVNMDKRPMVASWKDSKEVTEKQMRDPNFAGLGVKCGHPSKVVVLDIDVEKDRNGRMSGIPQWNKMFRTRYPHICRGFGEKIAFLPSDTTCIRTGSGGYHVYYRYNEEKMSKIKNVNGFKTPEGVFGIDIKTDGGYVVAPGSFNRKGSYKVLCGFNKDLNSLEIGDMPDDILEEILKSQGIGLKEAIEHRTTKQARSEGIKVSAFRERSEESSRRKPKIGGLTSQGLQDIVLRLSSKRALDYDSWRTGIWAIQETALDYEWNMEEALNIAHDFAALSPNYDEKGTDKKWLERLKEKKAKIRPTLGTILYWLREDDPEYYAEFMNSTIKTEFPLSFDVDDSYSITEFTDEMDGKYFDSLDLAWDYIARKLSLFARLIARNPPQYLIKYHDEISISTADPCRSYQRYNIKYGVTVDEKVKIKSMNAFLPLNKDRRLKMRGCRFLPCSPLKLPSDMNRIFNLFPGFRAKLVEEIDEELFEPILFHIREVWANGDQGKNEFILSWLAMLFQEPTVRLCALILVGGQGCGKGIICNMLRKMMVGVKNTVSDSIPETLTDRFNGYLTNKILCIIGETEEGPRQKTVDSRVLRALITDDVMVENKGVMRSEMDNYLHFIFCSNSMNAMKIDKGDRRFAVFECSDEYIDDAPYFDRLLSLCGNQSVANNFFTYLLRREVTVNVKKPMISELKKEMMEINLPPEEIYLNELKSGEWLMSPAPGEITVYLKADKRYVSSAHLHNDYLLWIHRSGLISKPLCKTTFCKFISRILGRDAADMIKRKGRIIRVFCIDSLVTRDNMEHFSSYCS